MRKVISGLTFWKPIVPILSRLATNEWLFEMIVLILSRLATHKWLFQGTIVQGSSFGFFLYLESCYCKDTCTTKIHNLEILYTAFHSSNVFLSFLINNSSVELVPSIRRITQLHITQNRVFWSTCAVNGDCFTLLNEIYNRKPTTMFPRIV